jgi:hypothetical protein
MLSLLYLALGRIFELLVLLGRSRERNKLEILVLRHELRVLHAGADESATDRRIGRCLPGCLAHCLWVPRTRSRRDLILVDEATE